MDTTTPIKQRIAIATACGWTKIIFVSETDAWVGTRPDKNTFRFPIPDYINDLNAMHDAEKVILAGSNWDVYWNWVIKIVYPKSMDSKYAAHSTASQRAEAFLKTLNLWTP